MLVVGLLLLAAAVVVGVAGVSANTGSEHQLAGGFGIFGYHVHDSAGKVFFAGLLIGAVGMLGFMMAADGLRRNAALRRELFRFRQDARARRRNAAATRPAPAAPATAPTQRVLAGTSPTPTGDTAGTGKIADSGGNGGDGSSGDGSSGASAAGVAAGAGASTSADRAAARRSLRNWRTTRPTS